MMNSFLLLVVVMALELVLVWFCMLVGAAQVRVLLVDESLVPILVVVSLVVIVVLLECIPVEASSLVMECSSLADAVAVPPMMSA